MFCRFTKKVFCVLFILTVRTCKDLEEELKIVGKNMRELEVSENRVSTIKYKTKNNIVQLIL